MFNSFLHILAVTEEKDLTETTSIREAFTLFGTFWEDLSEWFREEHLNLIRMALYLGIMLLAVFLLRWFVKTVLLRLVRKLPVALPAHLVERLNAPVTLLLILAGISLCGETVNFPVTLWSWLSKILYACFIMALLWGVFRVVGATDLWFQTKKFNEDHRLNELVVALIRRAIKTVVWVVAVIFIAQNLFHFDVTALVAGAGVAGLAIAFAAQNTVANLFGAMSIISDRTFKEGDRVQIGDSSGSVEEVGFRSTRLRALDGTVWHVPNRIAADSVIQNITRRPWLKYAFTIGLVYQTTPEQMHKALAILGGILDNHPAFNAETQPPLYFFTDFNASSLDISVTLWFQTTDYVQFQKWKQEINLAILEQFNAAGLDFAYPTSTNYLIAQNNNTAAIEGAVGK